ncbi:helicase C-terminal domain-containing protein, partial [Arthrospira platensis SPKY1]|nr:helicase C-terminal domain-containing protein [Arthrospira platensis SPKY1]
MLTSATLTSLGRFDFFLHEVGLADDPDVTTLEVASPFDFAKQGTLGLPAMQNDPKAVQAFTAEMVQALLADIAQVERGALVLFTSRDQMRQAVDALTEDLRERVLVQNELPRTRLLQTHQDRVAQGLPSVLFGLQSFGEGLDL